MTGQPQPNPTRTYEEAAARIAAIQGKDGPKVHPLSRTRFWTHGSRTRRALLYLHGYTDSTQQFNDLGAQLFQRGWNVFAPRLPHHGYINRLDCDHCLLTARSLVEWTSEATDAALGLGDELTVMGLSLGGVLATWVAQYRHQVKRVLIISPAYGNAYIPAAATPALARAVLRLPNWFVWWNLRAREAAGHAYSYPRLATHTMANVFLLSAELLTVARRTRPAVREVWMITNANDRAVHNGICRRFVAAWRAHGEGAISTFEFPRELGMPHDLMDPAEVGARPEVVFPKLIEILEG